VPRLLISSRAERDLLDIWDYIAAEAAPAPADAVLARLHGAMEVLAAGPLIGRERPEFDGTPRSIVVRPYVIFYEPLPEGDGILVWRVVHGARDLAPLVRPQR
jgi:plasmid stabilization system protein ParE